MPSTPRLLRVPSHASTPDRATGAPEPCTAVPQVTASEADISAAELLCAELFLDELSTGEDSLPSVLPAFSVPTLEEKEVPTHVEKEPILFIHI